VVNSTLAAVTRGWLVKGCHWHGREALVATVLDLLGEHWYDTGWLLQLDIPNLLRWVLKGVVKNHMDQSPHKANLCLDDDAELSAQCIMLV
jgi:hypothetical protein